MGFHSPINFLRVKWCWAKEKPLVWASLALLTGTVLFVFMLPGPVTDAGPSDFRIRAWAMILQVIGAWTVWHDLTNSARTFGKGEVLKGTWEWLKAGIFGRTITLQADASSHYLVGGRARLIQRRAITPDAPTEVRLAALEYNLQKIDDDLTSAYTEIDVSAAALKGQIGEESKKREEAHSKLEGRLKDAIVGNYGMLLFGAWWVLIGIVLSSLSPEIARIAAGQWAKVWAVI